MRINLKNAKVIKTVKGFGGSACWWSPQVKSEKTAHEIANLLYGDDGLRMNIYRFNVGGGYEKDNLRGLATVTIDDFVVKNVRIMDGAKGLFVSMPQYKSIGADGKAEYNDIVYPTSATMRGAISDKILESYQTKVKQKEAIPVVSDKEQRTQMARSSQDR